MEQIKITILDNKFLTIHTDNYHLLRAIDKEFSYKVQGAEYSQAFRNGGWDGIQHLLLQKNGINKLGLGLRNKLVSLLSIMGYEAIIEDNRPKPPIGPEIDIGPRLKQLGISLRDYQLQIVEIASNNDKGIIRSATGSGKSITIAALAAKINTNTIIYTIGIDLLNQFHQLFSSIFDDVGYIGNGICKIGKQFNILSVWSAASALGLKKDIINDDEYKNTEKSVSIENKKKIINLLKTASFHCFDECHTIGTSSFKSLYKEITPSKIFGFSGTPYRSDGSDLYSESVLGPQLIDINAGFLIKQNILAQPYIKFISVPKLDVSCRDYHSIYKEYVVENTIRNKLVVENAKTLIDKNYTVLCLFKQIRHGQILKEMFDDYGIEADLLDGNDKLEERERIKDKVKAGKSKILISSSIFDIGVDLPILSSLILASPSRSHNKVLQRIGRVIRKYPGKERALVIDFYDDIKYLREHSKIRRKIYLDEPGFIVKWPENK